MPNIEALSKDELIVKVIELQHRVSILEKLAFGPRRERFVADAPANQLALEVTADTVTDVEAMIGRKSR